MAEVDHSLGMLTLCILQEAEFRIRSFLLNQSHKDLALFLSADQLEKIAYLFYANNKDEQSIVKSHYDMIVSLDAKTKLLPDDLSGFTLSLPFYGESNQPQIRVPKFESYVSVNLEDGDNSLLFILTYTKDKQISLFYVYRRFGMIIHTNKEILQILTGSKVSFIVNNFERSSAKISIVIHKGNAIHLFNFEISLAAHKVVIKGFKDGSIFNIPISDKSREDHLPVVLKQKLSLQSNYTTFHNEIVDFNELLICYIAENSLGLLRSKINGCYWVFDARLNNEITEISLPYLDVPKVSEQGGLIQTQRVISDKTSIDVYESDMTLRASININLSIKPNHYAVAIEHIDLESLSCCLLLVNFDKGVFFLESLKIRLKKNLDNSYEIDNRFLSTERTEDFIIQDRTVINQELDSPCYTVVHIKDDLFYVIGSHRLFLTNSKVQLASVDLEINYLIQNPPQTKFIETDIQYLYFITDKLIIEVKGQLIHNSKVKTLPKQFTAPQGYNFVDVFIIKGGTAFLLSDNSDAYWLCEVTHSWSDGIFEQSKVSLERDVSGKLVVGMSNGIYMLIDGQLENLLIKN